MSSNPILQQSMPLEEEDDPDETDHNVTEIPAPEQLIEALAGFKPTTERDSGVPNSIKVVTLPIALSVALQRQKRERMRLPFG